MKKTVVVTIIMIILFLFNGCSDNPNRKDDSINDLKYDNDFYSGMGYAQNKEDITGIKGYAKSFLKRGDYIYFFSVARIRESEESDLVHEYNIYRMGNDNSPVQIASYMEDNSRLERIILSDNGTLYGLTYSTDDKEYGIRQFSNENPSNMQSGFNQKELQRAMTSESVITPYLYAFDKGYVTLFDNSIKLYDNLFNPVNEYNIPGEVIDACMPDDDCIYLLSKKKGEKNCIYRLRIESGTLDMYELEYGEVDYISEACSKYDIYMIGEYGISGLIFDEETECPLCDLKDTYIDSGDISEIFMINDDTFIVPQTTLEGEGRISVYSKNKEIESKEVLTLMGTYCSSELRNYVKVFNESHNDVRIEIIDFENYINPEQQMTLELTSGNIPDMYILDMNGVGNWSLEDCVRKGLFENLIPFVENDSEISVEDFEQNIYKSMLINDGLYFSGGFVGIHTLVIPNNDSETSSIKDFVSYSDATNPDALIFPYCEKDDRLNAFMSVYMDHYVNLQNKSVDLENDEFKYILELSNRGGTTDDEVIDYKKSFRDNEIIGLEMNCSISEIQIAEELYGNQFNSIGYPGKGALLSFHGAVAMSSSCNNKKLVWEFLRFFMTSDYVENEYADITNSKVPIRKDAIEAYIELYEHDDEYIDIFGNKINRTPVGSGIEEYGIGISIHKLTKEEKKCFYEILESIDGIYGCNQEIYSIIEDEAEDYFDGSKSKDEVISVMNNRIQTYINEME